MHITLQSNFTPYDKMFCLCQRKVQIEYAFIALNGKLSFSTSKYEGW